MPPAASKKSSRHSTPVSALTERSESATPATPVTATPTPAAPSSNHVSKETAYLRTSTSAIMSADPSIDALISGTSARNSEPPTAKELHGLHDKIRDTVNRCMSKRGEVCDRSMRLLVQRRKERLQIEREQEAEREAREQLAAKREQERSEREKVKKEKALSRKRSRDEMEVDGAESEERKQRRESLPSVGAHGLARQDGVGVHEGESMSSRVVVNAFNASRGCPRFVRGVTLVTCYLPDLRHKAHSLRQDLACASRSLTQQCHVHLSSCALHLLYTHIL